MRNKNGKLSLDYSKALDFYEAELSMMKEQVVAEKFLLKNRKAGMTI